MKTSLAVKAASLGGKQGGLANSSGPTEWSGRPNLYISSFIPLDSFRFKNHSPTHALLCVSMATVNMNCVEFYDPNPKPALKSSHTQLTRSVLNKHQLPLQPSRWPSAMSAGDVLDNDSFDDSLPSLEELLRPPQNGDTPQVPQNHKNVHISKRQLIDEGRLQTNPTTTNSAYVPGNTQSRFLSSLYAHIPY